MVNRQIPETLSVVHLPEIERCAFRTRGARSLRLWTRPAQVAGRSVGICATHGTEGRAAGHRRRWAAASRTACAAHTAPALPRVPRGWSLPGLRVSARVPGVRIRGSSFGAGHRWRSSSSGRWSRPVSYTHLRAHETRHDLVCRLLLEKK